MANSTRPTSTMKNTFRIGAFILTGVGFVILPAVLVAAPLTVEVTADAMVVSRYDNGAVDALFQTITLSAPATLSLDGVNNSISFTLFAPAGRSISVSPLGSIPTFYIVVDYRGGDATSLGTTGETTTSFAGLTGTAPIFFNETYITSDGLFFSYGSGSVESAFSFTSVTITTLISGTGADVTLNRTESKIEAADTDYSGPSTEPYPSLLSVPSVVPEPGTVFLSLLALGALIGGHHLKCRNRLAS